MAEIVFTGASLLVLPVWLLMIGLPGWSGTRRLMASTLTLWPLPFLYAALLVFYGRDFVSLLQTLALDPNGSIHGLVADILGSREGAAVAWVHLLAFDLFVGRWEYLDSQERHIHPLAMTPILWATFLLGPLGLLLYLLLRQPLTAKLPAASPRRNQT